MADRIVSVDETYRFPAPVRAALAELVGGPPGAPLGLCHHAPTLQAEHSVPTDNTAVSLAPALLAITITAPANGAVIVDLEAEISACGGRGYWGLMIGGSPVSMALAASAITTSVRGRTRHYVDGLTPGVSYNIEWAAAKNTGSFNIRAGGDQATFTATNSGPATMTAWAAP